MTISRRNFMIGAGAAGVMSGTLGTAFAQTATLQPIHKNGLRNYYLNITRQAFDKTYKNELTNDKIKAPADLAAAIEANWPAYCDALKEAAVVLAPQTDAQTQKSLRNVRNFQDQFSNDAENGYLRNRQNNFAREQDVQIRSGNEPTNPLLLKIHDYALAGVIERQASKDAIRDIDKELRAPLLVEEIHQAVVESLDAAVTPQGPAIRLNLKRN